MLRGEVETIAGALEEKTQACLAAEARVEKLEGALAKEIASYETQAERTTPPLPSGIFFFHTTNVAVFHAWHRWSPLVSHANESSAHAATHRSKLFEQRLNRPKWSRVWAAMQAACLH